MIRTLVGILVVLASVFPAPDSARAAAGRIAQIDRIVAVVNDEVVTRYELDDRIQLVTHQLRAQGTPLPPSDMLERQMLERMIGERILLQYARETGVRVDDAQLEKTLSRIAQDNGMNLQEFRRAVEQDGVGFGKFREEIRREMLAARLREREVDSRIVVSDGEIDAYLRNQEAEAGRTAEYLVAHILVLVPEQADPEKIRQRRARAEQALAQLNHGADFSQVAASHSDAPDALRGGALGWRARERLPAVFQEALKSMKPGELSPVLRSPNGFHILKLLDRRSNNAPALIRQTHARHILIKPGELLSESEAADRLLKLRERIENGASFAELARLHSEDGSAAQGGDLGWLSPGDTVPEFERAMETLQPGQISDPVQTQFGWHLIQVIERRSEDVSEERQRLLARQAIRALKADEAYQEWMRQLRDRAYIEYRLEEK